MQTSYKTTMDLALVGQIADLIIKTIDSFAAEEGLNPGVPVVRGTYPATAGDRNWYSMVSHLHGIGVAPFMGAWIEIWTSSKALIKH